MIIRYKSREQDLHVAANTFVAYDDVENYLGEACVESMSCPLVFEKRPEIFTIRVQGDKSAADALLGAATAHALYLARDAKGKACIRVEVLPGEQQALGSSLEVLGYSGKSAVLRMSAPVSAQPLEAQLPQGLTVLRDYLIDEQECAFYLERTNALFGGKRDMAWLEQARAKPHFTRVLLIDEHGAAGEMLLWAEDGVGVAENVWVHPDWRGKGAGKFLMECAREYWNENGLRRARMDIWSRLQPAIRLAYAAGFAPEEAVVEYPYMDARG